MATRTDRIESRVKPDDRARIEQAATLTGLSVSSFMVNAAVERAVDVIAQQATTTVPPTYFDDLLAALDDPDPAPRLTRAAADAERLQRITA